MQITVSQWCAEFRECSSDVQSDGVRISLPMYSQKQGDSGPGEPGVMRDRMEDPFENMREQMEKERDQFFKTAPSEWASDSNGMRGGIFNMVSSSE